MKVFLVVVVSAIVAVILGAVAWYVVQVWLANRDAKRHRQRMAERELHRREPV